MDNNTLVHLLTTTATLLELHQAPPSQVMCYHDAARWVERLPQDITTLSRQALQRLPGLRPHMADLIGQIHATGTVPYWEELKAQTPPGVLTLLTLRGLGPKKVRALWKQGGIVSIAELLRACTTGTLTQLPGFGPKTQHELQKDIRWHQQNQGKWLYAQALPYAHALTTALAHAFPHVPISLAGELRRNLEVVTQVMLVVGTQNTQPMLHWLAQQPHLQQEAAQSDPGVWRGQFVENGLTLILLFCAPTVFYQQLLLQTGAAEHLAWPVLSGKTLGQVFMESPAITSEAAGYQQAQLPYFPPELREAKPVFDGVSPMPPLLEMGDLMGVLHCHTTYSDGKHSLAEMAHYCKEQGYTYIGISDHSYSARYAGGLTSQAIVQQHAEIDRLNQSLAPFKIFKGIESDILLDGSLDYPAEVLARFDFVIASIHMGLRMDRQQATHRLLQAIRNPFTTILGHPTGRLLLQREGYPIDHDAILAACAAHGVILEINATPKRLDLDWRWVHAALRQSVWLSIHPDAHAKEQIANLYYGVCVARKGGLTKAYTFTALSQEAVAHYFQQRKANRGIGR